jgi:D-glycero-D-manno-heptose 1,7-bisphosphate phosphatase
VRTGNGGLLDNAQLAALLRQVPGTQVHDDLGAFADWMIYNERRLRGLAGENDSGYGTLS